MGASGPGQVAGDTATVQAERITAAVTRNSRLSRELLDRYRRREPFVPLAARPGARRDALAIGHIGRRPMLHEPSQQPRIVLALDTEVQRRPALVILMVHVGAVRREELRGREVLELPGSEEWCHPDDHVDRGSCADEQREVVDVIPPRGREEASAGRIGHARALVEQELHELRVARAGHGFEQRSAAILSPGLVDGEAEAEQVLDDLDLGGWPDAASPRLRRAREVKQGTPLAVRGRDEARRFAEEPAELRELEGLGCLEEGGLRRAAHAEGWPVASDAGVVRRWPV